MNTEVLPEATKAPHASSIPFSEMTRRESFPFLFLYAPSDPEHIQDMQHTSAEPRNVRDLTPRTLRGKAYSNIYITEAAFEFLGAQKSAELYKELHPTLLSSNGEFLAVQSS